MVTALLLLHTQPIGYLASAARETTLFPSDFAKLRIQLVADAGAALVVLFIATVLAVFKPPGMTRYGWRKQHQSRAGSKP